MPGGQVHYGRPLGQKTAVAGDILVGDLPDWKHRWVVSIGHGVAFGIVCYPLCPGCIGLGYTLVLAFGHPLCPWLLNMCISPYIAMRCLFGHKMQQLRCPPRAAERRSSFEAAGDLLVQQQLRQQLVWQRPGVDRRVVSFSIAIPAAPLRLAASTGQDAYDC